MSILNCIFAASSCLYSSFSDIVNTQEEYYEREMEKLVLRTNSLGKDRNYNRYWWFRRDGRIFVESSDNKLWGYYCSKEEVLNAEFILFPYYSAYACVYFWSPIFSCTLWWFPHCISKQLDALMGSLNCKGEREKALQKQLQKFYSRMWWVSLIERIIHMMPVMVAPPLECLACYAHKIFDLLRIQFRSY